MVGLELTVGEVDIFVGRNYVLSVRNRCEHGFTTSGRAASASPSFSHGAGFVFYALMDAVVDRYFPCSTRSRWSWSASRNGSSRAAPRAPTSRRSTGSSRS
jgi:hypothetical protein